MIQSYRMAQESLPVGNTSQISEGSVLRKGMGALPTSPLTPHTLPYKSLPSAVLELYPFEETDKCNKVFP